LIRLTGHETGGRKIKWMYFQNRLSLEKYKEDKDQGRMKIAKIEEMKNMLLNLPVVCPSCDGKGEKSYKDGWQKCSVCRWNRQE